MCFVQNSLITVDVFLLYNVLNELRNLFEIKYILANGILSINLFAEKELLDY